MRPIGHSPGYQQREYQRMKSLLAAFTLSLISACATTDLNPHGGVVTDQRGGNVTWGNKQPVVFDGVGPDSGGN